MNYSDSRYFEDPGEAVEQITMMLEDRNWKEFTKYYDLTNWDTDAALFLSGNFFYSEKKPEVDHPADFWKYKHPFPPGFDYKSFRIPEERNDIVEVTVGIETDQGEE